MEAYFAALPRLHATESLDATTRVAVGTGSTKDGPRIIRAWRDELAGTLEGRAPRSHLGTGQAPLAALSALQTANEAARAEGTLWEQRVERGEVRTD